MTIGEMRSILNARFLCGEASSGEPFECAAASDLMSDVLAFVKAGSVLITGLVNMQVVRTAEMAEVRAVCFVNGKQPSADIIDAARGAGIPLMMSEMTLFDACGKLHEAGVRSCREP